ncbi:MAG: bifunctional enoyl-CoA hydratase/phosphate acetyltransferase [Clostridiales bacterium]|nr:bifunctional enoyl-CoA hydratase/phosphate acetyltransferase [Clostridiales bacterium]
MFQSFEQIEAHVLGLGIRKKIALAGANDHEALTALVDAKRRGIAQGVLVGDGEGIRRELAALGESEAEYEIVEAAGETQAAQTACRLVAQGGADIPMKGLMQTATFMRAILNKEFGFVPEGTLLSHSILVENTLEKKLFLITDCVINIAPDYADKVKILNNAVALMHKLGWETPRVAVLAPVEVVNPNMPSTVDAAMLSKAQQRGQIKGCLVDGPLGLDNAVSPEAARHKGIQSEVAGVADILLMPDIGAGNIFCKSLTYFARFPNAGAMTGTTVPVVMTSRTDTPRDKLNAILLAILQAL